jgi:prepilin-type N-terminal cleavage/methylation domain-containing protein
MKIFQPKNKAGFTLVEIMIVVLIIGILLAIAIPNFVAARESSRAKACIGNLKQIDSATQQYCMDQKLSSTTYAGALPTIGTGTTTNLVGTAAYIRTTPTCPSSGTYGVAPLITGSPFCTISATSAGVPTAAGSTGYGMTEKFYHGLQ